MKRLLADRDISSLSKLESEIKSVLKELESEYIINPIDSFSDRFREVIARRGKATSY